MNKHLTEMDRETIGEVINLASELPSSEDLTTLTPAQAMCIGFIKGMSAKVESHEEKE